MILYSSSYISVCSGLANGSWSWRCKKSFQRNSSCLLWRFQPLLCWLSEQIDIQFWSKWSSWAWLIGLAASTTFDLLKLHHLQTKLDNTALLMDSMTWHDLADQILLEMHTVKLSFWRDFCDLFIPLSALQYASPGLGAFCGVVSSLIGFQLEWEKHVSPFKINKSLRLIWFHLLSPVFLGSIPSAAILTAWLFAAVYIGAVCPSVSLTDENLVDRD